MASRSTSPSSSDSEDDNRRKRRRKTHEPKTERVCDFTIQVPPESKEAAKRINRVAGDTIFPLIAKDGVVKVMICAQAGSGKTTVLYNILNEVVTKDMKVLIYAQSHQTDPVWAAIKRVLEGKGCLFAVECDFKEDGVNRMRELRERLAANPEKHDKYTIVLDDQGDSMRDKHLGQLLKTNRHKRLNFFICTQQKIDIFPAAWNDFDYTMLYQAQPEGRLRDIHEHMGVRIPLEKFLELYKHATEGEDGHNFFLVPGHGGKDFRKNFDQRFTLD